MAKPKITVLIALIGKHPQHVERFIGERGHSLKRVYLLHTCDKDQPPSRDGNDDEDVCTECGRGGLIDYGELANKFVKKLQRKYKPDKGKPKSGIKIISKTYQDAHDLWELQDRITDIVEEEKDNGVLEKNIALEISGGTNIGAAAQIFAIYNLEIIPFYVDNKPDENDEWVRPIITPDNWGKTLSEPAKQLLIDIVDSEFTVKAKGFSETPNGEDPRPVKGQITRHDLINLMQRRIKKIGKVARPSTSSLELLKKFKLIEILPEYEAYHNTSIPKSPIWELTHHSKPAYRATHGGRIAKRRLKIPKKPLQN